MDAKVFDDDLKIGQISEGVDLESHAGTYTNSSSQSRIPPGIFQRLIELSRSLSAYFMHLVANSFVNSALLIGGHEIPPPGKQVVGVFMSVRTRSTCIRYAFAKAD